MNTQENKTEPKAMLDVRERLNTGLELARCTQANLENLKKEIPIIKNLPMFTIVEIQIRQTVEALEGEMQHQKF